MKKACKAFWNWAMKNEFTTYNPFYGIEIGSENYGTPYYITKEERNKVAEYDFSDIYKKVKDLNIIGRMSGHVEGSQAFVRYRDIDDDMLREAIKEIE